MARPTLPATGVLVFDVPLPPRPLSPNKRHPSRQTLLGRSAASETYKHMVMAEALNAVRAHTWTTPQRARVSLLFGMARVAARDRSWENSLVYRPGDADNAVASFKAGFDGLTAARVIVDDDWEHMALGAVEMVKTDGPWVRVIVERWDG